MENISQIESILYTNKTKISSQTYIELMNQLSKLYKNIHNHKNIKEGIECPHCGIEIEYDEIEEC